MSIDLVADLKSRLSIVDVIGRDESLRSAGRKMVGVNHQSLEVDLERGLWTWFSQSAAAGQRALGGDVLSWIAFKRFGRIDVEREDFIEVLKLACSLAGISFPEKAAGGGRGSELTVELRAREETLRKYLEVCEAGRTAEFFVRAKQRKSYLTEEVCLRWRLGASPSLADCLAAGLTELELRRAGLLRDPQREGPDERPYMFFRDSIVIPYLEHGRVVYLSSRFLNDFDGTGKKREKKTLHLPGVKSKADELGHGMPRPCGFNLEARYHSAAKLVGLMLVEAPLDAIACTEREHPAIAMLGSNPHPELVKILRRVA